MPDFIRRVWCILLMLLFQIGILKSQVMQQEKTLTQCEGSKADNIIKVAIIANLNFSDRAPLQRLNAYAFNFTARTFPGQPVHILNIPILTDNCTSRKDETSKKVDTDKYDVPTRSHLEAWRLFYLANSICPKNKLVVFQHDAALGRKDAGAVILQYLPSMTEDITYFGYCFKSYGIPKFLKRRKFIKFHPRVTGLAPHCLHAYAVSVDGARRLLEQVDPCGPPADVQVAALANKGFVSFKFSNASYDHAFTAREFAAHGLHWKVTRLSIEIEIDTHRKGSA